MRMIKLLYTMLVMIKSPKIFHYKVLALKGSILLKNGDQRFRLKNIIQKVSWNYIRPLMKHCHILWMIRKEKMSGLEGE